MDRYPRVLVSFAQSIDGQIATKSGQSQWISGDESLRLSQELRRDNESILVGIGTLLTDDPLLTCRLPQCKSPLRVVLDSSLRIPLNSQIVKTASAYRSLVFFDKSKEDRSKRETLEAKRIDCIGVPGNKEGYLDLHFILRELTKREITSLFVEGGSRVISSFFKHKLVNRLIVVLAPIILGEGTASIGDLGINDLDDAVQLEPSRPKLLGRDLVWDLEVKNE